MRRGGIRTAGVIDVGVTSRCRTTTTLSPPRCRGGAYRLYGRLWTVCMDEPLVWTSGPLVWKV